MPTVPLPDQSAPSPKEPTDSSWSSWVVEIRKDIYHLATIFLVAAPFIIQMRPQWADKVEKAEDVAREVLKQMPKPETPPTPAANPLAAAWAKDKDRESLKLLRYLYLRTQIEAASQWKDLDELYKSFRAEEAKLGLTDKLKDLRAVSRTSWAHDIPEIPPAALSGPLRARIVDFLGRQIQLLDRLE